MAHKYKVLAGIHIEGGREYKKDDVVTSDFDLMKFANKFQDLGPAPEQRQVTQAPAPAPTAGPAQQQATISPAPSQSPPGVPGKGKVARSLR